MRCVNLDWLEVYCMESRSRYPCNADYFRDRGYFVKERPYGTRQYNQMFVIEDELGEPWLEIRRDPASGNSSFCGLVPESTHIRLVNRACYFDDAVERLRTFLMKHEYIFKRIYRIDICYDFEHFDSGDDPAKFLRRYLERKYRKINQCKVATHGDDTWTSFDWESLSWGSLKSMVSTKIYNKSLELATHGNSKPYIVWSWYLAGLISDPVSQMKIGSNGHEYKPTIWRVEFSIKSTADNWVVIEDQSGKRVKKTAVPHRLNMFDSRDKIWARFEELAFHYFHFKHFEEGQRKDRCKDKVLFHFNRNRDFYQVSALPTTSRQPFDDVILKRRLEMYRNLHANLDIRKACDTILDALRREELRRVSPRMTYIETEALRRAIAIKMKWPQENVVEVVEEIKQLLFNDEIF